MTVDSCGMLFLIAYFGMLGWSEIKGALVIGRDNISIVKARCLKVSICGVRRILFLIRLTVTYAVLKSIEGCSIFSCKFAVPSWFY